MTGRLPESFGRFVVIEEIGHGAMGVVYRARDPMIDRVVAIKTITLAGTEEERAHFEARFQQEARAAGGLSHPAIVTIFDYGREGDTAFMAMEVLEGRELRDLIREGGIPPAEAVEIAARVAEALAFAHERGVVHRDVKPGNIMVLADGRVKIMDFGIARLDAPGVKTATGLLLGSPRYMAPEQAAGESFDGRADVFSLGVVLYEMLTGAAPFSGRRHPAAHVPVDERRGAAAFAGPPGAARGARLRRRARAQEESAGAVRKRGGVRRRTCARACRRWKRLGSSRSRARGTRRKSPCRPRHRRNPRRPAARSSSPTTTSSRSGPRRASTTWKAWRAWRCCRSRRRARCPWPRRPGGGGSTCSS
ncbi:MAG: serine/threonine protein kinase [Betaproteobacteria bacterium]|nr:serine/threonine protein kinase [Betaproteobacteria bacterium]